MPITRPSIADNKKKLKQKHGPSPSATLLKTLEKPEEMLDKIEEENNGRESVKVHKTLVKSTLSEWPQRENDMTSMQISVQVEEPNRERTEGDATEHTEFESAPPKLISHLDKEAYKDISEHSVTSNVRRRQKPAKELILDVKILKNLEVPEHNEVMHNINLMSNETNEPRLGNTMRLSPRQAKVSPAAIRKPVSFGYSELGSNTTR